MNSLVKLIRVTRQVLLKFGEICLKFEEFNDVDFHTICEHL